MPELAPDNQVPSGPQMARGSTRKVPPLYFALRDAFDERRRAIGVSLEGLSDAAGVADRYCNKAWTPLAPSGRVARLETLQEICDALFPFGLKISLTPLPPSPENKCFTPLAKRARELDSGPQPLPLAAAEYFRACGARGGKISPRLANLSKRRWKQIARNAAHARWDRPRPEAARAELAVATSRR